MPSLFAVTSKNVRYVSLNSVGERFEKSLSSVTPGFKTSTCMRLSAADGIVPLKYVFPSVILGVLNAFSDFSPSGAASPLERATGAFKVFMSYKLSQIYETILYSPSAEGTETFV